MEKSNDQVHFTDPAGPVNATVNTAGGVTVCAYLESWSALRALPHLFSQESIGFVFDTYQKVPIVVDR